MGTTPSYMAQLELRMYQIGDDLAQYRAAKGWSVRGLARAIGVHEKTIRNLEANRHRFSKSGTNAGYNHALKAHNRTFESLLKIKGLPERLRNNILDVRFWEDRVLTPSEICRKDEDAIAA